MILPCLVPMKSVIDLVLDALKSIFSSKLIEKAIANKPQRDYLPNDILSEPERSGLLALHALLREHDPHHEKLGLKRMPTYTGDYLWLCKKHYQDAQSIIPDRIE